MIDTLTKLCEKLVDLIHHYQLHRKKEFNVHVAPLFGYMREIHEDYTASFAEICTALNDCTIPDTEIVLLVETKRRQLAHIRELIHALSRCYAGSFYAKVVHHHPGAKHTKKRKTLLAADFVDSIVQYLQFSCGEPELLITGRTRYIGLLDVLESVLDRSLTRQEAIKYADDMRSSLPHAWRRFSRRFVALRECLLK